MQQPPWRRCCHQLAKHPSLSTRLTTNITPCPMMSSSMRAGLCQQMAPGSQARMRCKTLCLHPPPCPVLRLLGLCALALGRQARCREVHVGRWSGGGRIRGRCSWRGGGRRSLLPDGGRGVHRCMPRRRRCCCRCGGTVQFLTISSMARVAVSCGSAHAPWALRSAAVLAEVSSRDVPVWA